MKKSCCFLLIFWFLHLFSQYRQTEGQIDSTLNSFYISQNNDLTYLEPLLTEVYYRSGEINYTKGKLEALLRLSSFYLNTNKNPAKIASNLDEAQKLALKINDYFYYCQVLAIRAGVLANQSLFSESEHMLRKGSHFITEIEEKDKRDEIKVYYYARFVNLYALQNKEDSVFFYAKKMYQNSLRLPDENLRKNSYIMIAARVLSGVFNNRKKVEEASYYIKVQEKYINSCNNNFDRAMFYRNKARLILLKDFQKNIFLDSALYHLKMAEKCIGMSNNAFAKIDILTDIAELYKIKNDTESRLIYLNLLKNVRDKAPTLKNNNTYRINSDWIIPEFDQEMMDSHSNQPLWLGSYGIYLFILVIVTVSAFVSFLLLKKRSASRKNSSILRKPTTVPLIHQSITELTHQALNKDRAFFIHFMKEFPHFADKLTHINPNIKVSDIEFCALLSLNLENRQIADMKKMSVPAVNAKKTRIRKKLNIDTSENLQLWMRNLLMS